MIENFPKSLAELDDSDCHEAVFLSNQKNFKTLQTRLTNLLDKHITPEIRDTILTEQRQKKESQTILSVNNGHFLNKATGEIQSDVLCTNTSGIINHIVHNDPSIISKYEIVSEPFIQIGTQPSNMLHKDNGSSLDDNVTFDYTIVIPIMNYNLLTPNQHDYEPESTQIIPQRFKHRISSHANKSYFRGAIFYPNASEAEKHYLVSEKLKQGTIVAIRTATPMGSPDDGNSVIHKSPETPFGHLRCFVFLRANKKT